MNNGFFVISLDFELLWGVFDKVNWTEKKEYFQNTRKLIPEILQLFEKYEVHCTWATVGMLFNDNWDEWNQNIPEVIPNYDNHKLSAYNFGKSIQSKETEELCFAPDLIRMIKESSKQEIGTHTYSHYYCLEPGQTTDSFRDDLLKIRELAEKFEISLKSLVFPRNQFNPEYLKVCQETGISNVRSNPDNWYWQDTQKDTLEQKIFRTGDAYIGIRDKSYKISSIEEVGKGLKAQKASRLLRPYSGKKILEKFKIDRIKNEITKTARKGEIYHLWWHPHNFGGNPDESLLQLREILKHFQYCKSKYGLKSCTMDGLRIELENREISTSFSQ